MCGIVFAYTPAAPTTAATLAAMGAALRHRGPDDEGHLLWHPFDASFGPPRLLAGADTPAEVLRSATPWQPGGRLEEQPRLSAPLAMGHRRLAVVDLSPWGHQPMVRDGRWHVVYNGEIYNHIELRAELEALGQSFLTHSDSEVLLAAIATWGPQAALARCNGMWAFALLDTERRTVLISRDRFGVKPLYLWRGDDGALLLASEVKALLQHPAMRSAPALQACAAYLQRGPQAWRAETEFTGITRFPPGHFAEFSLQQAGPLQPQAFWQRPPAADPLEPFTPLRAQALCQRYAELLEDAVRLRLRADVRLGTALSGGLDSSSVAAMVNTQLRASGRDEKQETFSSVYRGAGNAAVRGADESAFVERVVQQLGVRCNLVEPVASEVPRAHEHMVWALDTPPAGTLMSSWHTYALVARRGVVVTLDGQGADEQLAGYSRYVRNLLVHAPLAALPGEVAALLKLQGFGAAVAIGLGGQLLRRVAGRGAVAALAARLHMGADPAHTVNEALAQDFHTHLQNLLHYGDKTSMAWSVESRMPFMDVRLVEFLATVPPAYKIHDGWTKWLARQALSERLPPEVTWRRDKMGWAVPESAWFNAGEGPLAGWLQQQLQGSAFAQQAAAQAGIVSARATLTQRLRLLNLAVWHRLFFEEGGRPGRALGRTMPLHIASE
jgi:asparagine synthase (glutamine-hydrolysing)